MAVVRRLPVLAINDVIIHMLDVYVRDIYCTVYIHHGNFHQSLGCHFCANVLDCHPFHPPLHVIEPSLALDSPFAAVVP